jgi:hypothetical protein
MNRTIKDATVKRYFYDTHDQLRAHLQNFVDAYNFARRLKTLRGLTPYEFICKAWTSDPHRSKISPLQQMPGLNSCFPDQQTCAIFCDDGSGILAIGKMAVAIDLTQASGANWGPLPRGVGLAQVWPSGCDRFAGGRRRGK